MSEKETIECVEKKETVKWKTNVHFQEKSGTETCECRVEKFLSIVKDKKSFSIEFTHKSVSSTCESCHTKGKKVKIVRIKDKRLT